MLPDRLARLPETPDTWEIDLLPTTMQVEGAELEGVLLVVEASTGTIRLLTALERGTDLQEPLVEALLRPEDPAAPARPRAVACRSASVRARVTRALAPFGIEVRRVDALPALDRAAAGLADELGSPPPEVVEEAEPEILDAVDHTLTLGTLGATTPSGETVTAPAIVVKLGKGDATWLAGELDPVDRLTVIAASGATRFYVHAGDEDALLTVVDDVPPETIAALRRGRAWLLLVGGGARRTTLRTEDVVWSRLLAVVAV